MTAEEELQGCSQMAEQEEEVGGQQVVHEMVAGVVLEGAVGEQNVLEWVESAGLVVAREAQGEEADDENTLAALRLPHHRPRFHSPHIAKPHVVV